MTKSNEAGTRVDIPALRAAVGHEYENVCGLLLTKVAAGDVSPKAKIPFKVLVAQQVLLHRENELLGDAIRAFDDGHLVSSALLARAALECAATLYDAAVRMNETDSSNFVDFDEWIMKILFGARDPSIPVEIPNILTIVDRASKRVPHLRELYDELSEFSHPNWTGTQASYSRTDEATHTAYFEAHQHERDWPRTVSLNGIMNAALVSRLAHSRVKDDFQRFREIAELALKQSRPPDLEA